MIKFAPLALSFCAVTSACTLATPNTQGSFREPDQIAIFTTGPEGAAKGSCWGKDETQAVVETITRQVLVKPAVTDASGSISQPAVYETQTTQRIVHDREAIWFEALCKEAFTPEFIASMQRALALRGAYRGPVTGTLTPLTEKAIRIFQKDQGLNSPVLSLIAARKLGLVAYSRDDIRTF